MSRERILHILDFISHNTDEDHGVTLKEISNYLKEEKNQGNISPLTIRRDISKLVDLGYGIAEEHGAHNTAYYKLVERDFTFNEIRFIVDSVSINKFLTPQQKRSLINKFEKFSTPAELRQLSSRISLEYTASPSLDLLDNLDKIHTLISQKRFIDFSYGKFDTDHNVVYYKKSRSVLPVRVVYFHDKFYLKCFDVQNDQFRTYRVDRMNEITGGDVYDKPLPKEHKHNAFIADMFPPDYFDTVTLRIKKFLLDEMIEQLCSYASVREDFDDPEYDVVHARVGVNRQFFLWIMSYGDGVEILSPVKVKEQFIEELKKVCSQYPEMTDML